MDTIREIVYDHIHSRRQIFKLAISDLIRTYSGAAFGWAWAIIRPAITIFVFWFTFEIGLRHRADVNGYPFFLYLLSGFVPWFFMRDSLTSGAGSIRKYKYLVQRIKYPVDTIPTFVCLSGLISNLGIFCIMVGIYIGAGHMPDKYYLQIPIYYVMAFIFFAFWSLFAGMLSAISKDFLNMVKSTVTVLFWMSGIIYDPEKVASKTFSRILMYNPVTIITSGFRNTFIYHRWFFEDERQLAMFFNFWIVTLVMMLLAIWAYRKLKKEIPDVL